MKLKDVVKFIVGNQYILFTPDNRRVYMIYSNTARFELPCQAYEDYLYFADCNVVSIDAKEKDVIRIAIEDREGE